MINLEVVRMAVAAQKQARRTGRSTPTRTRAIEQPPSLPQPRPDQNLAAAIIRAGKVRRAEIDTDPKPTGLAAQIIAAGKKARGET